MISRCVKILVAIILSLMFTISLAKLVICLWDDLDFSSSGRLDVDLWLDQNQLSEYKDLFRINGESIKTFFYFIQLFMDQFQYIHYVMVVLFLKICSIFFNRIRVNVFIMSFCVKNDMKYMKERKHGRHGYTEALCWQVSIYRTVARTWPSFSLN